MPLGIVSNRDFELERNNSDDSVSVEKHNGHKINFDESVNEIVDPVVETEDSETEDSDKEDIKCSSDSINSINSIDSLNNSISSNETSAAIPTSELLIPEIVTSEMIRNTRGAGRHESVTNVPQALRKLIAEESIEHGNKSAKNFVNQLGATLSDPTISTYKSGNVSPKNAISTLDNDLLEYINLRKGKLGKKALNKLNLALTHLDESKMSGLDAKELSGVAKDMAIIVDKMQPTQRESEKTPPVQFVIMAPQINNESHYQTVKAKDNY